jgi:hypothetical protein
MPGVALCGDLTGSLVRDPVAGLPRARLLLGLLLELGDARAEIGAQLLRALVLGRDPEHLLQGGQLLLPGDSRPVAGLGLAVDRPHVGRHHPSLLRYASDRWGEVATGAPLSRGCPVSSADALISEDGAKLPASCPTSPRSRAIATPVGIPDCLVACSRRPDLHLHLAEAIEAQAVLFQVVEALLARQSSNACG